MPHNREQRHSPTDLDESPAKLAPVLEFDISRLNQAMKDPWPEKYFGQKFGPSLIRKALAAGLYVMAEIEGFPRPVVVSDAKWDGGAFVVVTAEGLQIPERIWTLSSLKGYQL